MMKTTQTTLNLIQRALQFTDLENFVDALKLTHLVELIKSGGPFTVFAPVNKAFLNRSENILSILQEDESLLGTLIQHHVVAGKYYSEDLLNAPKLKSLIGETLFVSARKGHLWVNAGRLSRRDLEATNGVLHIVDRLLLPDAVTHKVGKSSPYSGVSNV